MPPGCDDAEPVCDRNVYRRLRVGVHHEDFALLDFGHLDRRVVAERRQDFGEEPLRLRLVAHRDAEHQEFRQVAGEVAADPRCDRATYPGDHVLFEIEARLCFGFCDEPVDGILVRAELSLLPEYLGQDLEQRVVGVTVREL